ncbi:MAG: hypothetical protein IPP05_22125 [Cytophagaceae bacterium]|nr:hypothetical protein [Cytophagaceae bacterium]
MEKLTNINKLRNPNYLGSWDLQDEAGKTTDIIVSIKDIKQDEVFDQQKGSMDMALTVYFHEVKPIILNATNRKMLVKVTGTEFIEQMVGKKIQLTTKRIKAFGEMHDAIRIVQKKSSELQGDAHKPKPVDIELCIKKLTTGYEEGQLVEVWQSLSAEEKQSPEVLAKKEELKSKINAGT